MSIYHQHRSTYVLGIKDFSSASLKEAVREINEVGITEWSRVDPEPLHFEDREGGEYLAFGHGLDPRSNLCGYRFVNVVRPDGMRRVGWHEEEGK